MQEMGDTEGSFVINIKYVYEEPNALYKILNQIKTAVLKDLFKRFLSSFDLNGVFHLGVK